MVELRQSPVNETQLSSLELTLKQRSRYNTDLSSFMIDHDVVRLDITMHYAFAVAKVQSLYDVSFSTSRAEYVAETHFQELENVESDIIVRKFWIEGAKIRVVDELEDQ